MKNYVLDVFIDFLTSKWDPSFLEPQKLKKKL